MNGSSETAHTAGPTAGSSEAPHTAGPPAR